jgi:hypothetical protein
LTVKSRDSATVGPYKSPICYGDLIAFLSPCHACATLMRAEAGSCLLPDSVRALRIGSDSTPFTRDVVHSLSGVRMLRCSERLHVHWPHYLDGLVTQVGMIPSTFHFHATTSFSPVVSITANLTFQLTLSFAIILRLRLSLFQYCRGCVLTNM